MDQQEDEHKPVPIEPGHVMKREKYEQMVQEQQQK